MVPPAISEATVSLVCVSSDLGVTVRMIYITLDVSTVLTPTDVVLQIIG